MTREWLPGDPIPERPGGYAVVLRWNEVALGSLLRVASEHYTAGALALADEIRRAMSPSPLVVIDPEDRQQVEALRDAMPMEFAWTAVQESLRSLIAAPKPEEPTGLGAVVEDVRGGVWVKWSTTHRADRNWKRHDENGGNYLAWSDMQPIAKIHSAGWTA